MSEQQKKDNRGYMYPQNKTNPKQPDFTGKIMIDGKELRISAWKNRNSTGEEYLSLAISPLQLPQNNDGSSPRNNTPKENNIPPQQQNNVQNHYEELDQILNLDNDSPF